MITELPEIWWHKVTELTYSYASEWRFSPYLVPSGFSVGSYVGMGRDGIKGWSNIDHKYFFGDIELNEQEFLNLAIGIKLTGYRLIKPEYKMQASEIAFKSGQKINLLGYSTFSEKFQYPTIHINESPEAIIELKKAGVLDIWFEPVFETFKEPLPSILGYEGVDNGDSLSWGCKKISKSALKELFSAGVVNIVVSHNGLVEMLSREEHFPTIEKYLK